jgi:hypothetical protein
LLHLEILRHKIQTCRCKEIAMIMPQFLAQKSGLFLFILMVVKIVVVLYFVFC